MKNSFIVANLKIFISSLVVSFLLIYSNSAAEEFAVTRVKYSGGGDWYSDPSSLVNLQSFVSENLGIKTAKNEKIISILDEELFSTSYLYLTGHGNLFFSENEAERLREYLLGGGFIHVDDNYGLDESFRREIKKVFPDNNLVEIPFSHPIYNMVYNFDNGLPKIHEHDNNPPQGLAIIIDERVVLFYTYECDLGDGWEDPDVHNDPEEKHLDALKMGANIIAYVLAGKPLQIP